VNTPPWVRWSVLLILPLLLVVGVYFLLRNADAPPLPSREKPELPVLRTTADPRLTYNGPYRNIHPDVKYVGDAACADCHFDQVETFRHHPMGRSLFPIAEEPNPAPLDPASRQPFQALGRTYRVERKSGRTWHHESRLDDRGQPIAENSFEVKYAIGSGTHGQSFLRERDGYVVQSPITWYGQKKIWDVSPGWTEATGPRPVEGRCLFCHSNQVSPTSGRYNHFAEPLFRGHTIGCERCHGPGERHVAKWSGKEPVEPGQDFSIVNPRHLPWQQREAVCQQCHLEGETRIVRRGRALNDFRPGLPLENFWTVAIHDEEDHKVVNHVEQMYRSTCFERSGAESKLGCISCHDPHVKPSPEQRTEYFRKSCLKCHKDGGSEASKETHCRLPQSERLQRNQNSCFECHMPKQQVSDVPHVAGTDHRITRAPQPIAAHVPTEHRYRSGQLPVRLFHRRATDVLIGEDRRDLGVMLAECVNHNKVHVRYSVSAIELLDASLSEVPADVDAWEAKGVAMVRAGRPREALAAFHQGLQTDANQEMCLVGAGHLSQRLDQNDEAIELWKRAVRINPFHPLYHGALAILYAGKQQWQQGKEYAEKWVELDPLGIESRRLRTLYLLRLGDRTVAQREFALIEALKPPNLPELQKWWATESKR